jgi:hypothetical protein
MANLRVVYDNAADRSTPSASTTAGALAATNLLTDIKSEVWRSTATSATLTLTWAAAESVAMVAIPYCNLTATATMRVRCYTNTGDATPVLDTGTFTADSIAPFDGWGTGANMYAFGGGSSCVTWFNSVSVKKVVIDLTDTSNTAGYIEAGRLIVGGYWELTYNPDYGVTAGMNDLSTHERTDSGDLRTDRGAMYKTLSFDLNYMPAADRNILWRIARTNGMYKPLYVNLIPSDTDQYEEKIYQIYGKLSKGAAIKFQFMNQFATSLEIEEV